MQKLNVQVNRLNYLIRDLLDTTNIAEGKLQLYSREIDFNQLLAERVEELQRISEKHTLILQAGNINTVMADKERIGQVLTKLVSNAVKYSPEGGKIVIKTEAIKGSIKVSVADQGIGIADDIRHRIFDLFFRANNSKLETFPGMGLGLYISAGIIQRHGGTIAVESELGKGSVFYFTLPLTVSS